MAAGDPSAGLFSRAYLRSAHRAAAAARPACAHGQTDYRVPLLAPQTRQDPPHRSAGRAGRRSRGYRQPDHIAVTGDLVNIALGGEFVQARDYLAKLGSGDHVTVVPGNHDAYVALPWAGSTGLWNDYMTGRHADEATRSGRHGMPRDFPFMRRLGRYRAGRRLDCGPDRAVQRRRRARSAATRAPRRDAGPNLAPRACSG